MAHVEDYDVASDEEEQEAFTDGQYFESYAADIAVTKVMLEDEPRMRFYREALEAEDLRGKVVVDVGAGTGILSLFAARAGAKRVIAIEASAMAATTRHVVRENGYDAVVHVVHMPAERVTLEFLREQQLLLDDEAVDVVVSEWMGFYLLHENMLPSVLHVRDALQAKRMVPSEAHIFAAPVDMTPFLDSRCRRQWRDVAGFNLATVGRIEEAALLACNPCVHVFPAECLLHEPFPVAAFDLLHVTERELNEVAVEATLEWGSSLTARHAAAVRPDAALWGFAVWFDVSSGDRVLRTGPRDEPTHWKQCVVLLPEDVRGHIPCRGLVEDGDSMGVQLAMHLRRATRSYDITINLYDPNE